MVTGHDRLDVLPPAPIMGLLILCLCVVFATIILGISLQLDFGQPVVGNRKIMLMALIGGLLPIMTAWSIATNRAWSRWAIVIWLVITIGWLHSLFQAGGPFLSGRGQMISDVMSVMFAAMCIAYLFLNRNARVYYLMLNEKPVPADLLPQRAGLEQSEERYTKASGIGRMVLEIALVITILGSVIVGLYVVSRG